MQLDSEIEFPPIEACLKSPHHIKSNVGAPSAVLSSPLNPSAEVFTPRSSINVGNCLTGNTLEQIPQITVEMDGLDSNIGAGGDESPPEYKKPLSQPKSRPNSNSKRSSFEKRNFAGKRKLSMTSLANSTISSIDTNISDTVENENDPDVLSRREKNIKYGKNTNAYERYIQIVPKKNRDKNSPKTPIKDLKYSRRQWDGLIKHWKINLHKWDAESNGAPSYPNSSTPKRPKTKCDRRSLTNTSSVNTKFDCAMGDSWSVTIKDMFSKAEEKDRENDETKDEEMPNPTFDWLQNTGQEQRVDWSKECETEDEAEPDEGQNKENFKRMDQANLPTPTTCEMKNVQSDNKVMEDGSKKECTGNIPAENISKGNEDEEGTVYKCISLVEAIAQFDENSYNEDEDEDYVPPERGLTLEEIGDGALNDESDDSSDDDTLFYQVVQRNQPSKF